MMIRNGSSKFLLKLLRHSLFTPSNRGWTLIEVGVVAVIVGILASLAVPSFGKMQARNQLRGAMAQVQGAFQEAQRNAIKKGATCTVSIDASNRTVTQATGTPNNGCVPNPVTIPASQRITMTSPSSTTSIAFSYKGNPSTTTDQTIVLTHEITSLEPRCLVIAAGVGIMRSGYYQGSTCTPAP
ncbi:Tfp pilus assembly protein FimT/FimU [Synechocystis sp. PCC 6714]|uniref:pilus assembly FimT family protein n=2 Tax=unclassified Synechocystis TaxID=2640012 RepID=UPI00068F4532|nr:GspH/FimT family pseudopilin [Synechocystis sp. PCC 6714]MCT0254915.1 prepilin-type N-terminal cleavage/methylation domain-containing protein [Synechocystis sp. CS-94]